MKFLKGKNAARTISIMVVGLLLAAVLLVDNKSYSAYVEQRLIDAAGAFGVQVGFKHTRVYPIAFAGDAATITVPAGKIPLTINLEDVKISPCWLSFLPCLELSGSAYGGFARVGLVYPPMGQLYTRASLNEISLSDHPQLQSLGVRGGSVNLEIAKLGLTVEDILETDSVLKITGLSLPKKTILPAAMTGLPMEISIPAIAKLDLETHLVSDGGVAILKPFKLNSSLGSLEGSAQIKLAPGNRITSLDVTGLVSLTKQGSADLGTFLPLLSQGKLSSKTQTFSLTISGTPTSPKIELKARP
ncbi:MAG: hypothetical protein GX589_11335 [Deltaproteobacteria bacterium]|nr:hypothetical protein [Deltaproteobacteria bacterium]